ncbi:MAG: hypothetical protein ACK5MV_00025 [Aminipila sp.]
MRRFYVILNEQNIVVTVIDTPLVYSQNNYIEVGRYATELLGATYKADTNEFIRSEANEVIL